VLGVFPILKDGKMPSVCQIFLILKDGKTPCNYQVLFLFWKVEKNLVVAKHFFILKDEKTTWWPLGVCSIYKHEKMLSGY
jgi:hypothetical protein